MSAYRIDVTREGKWWMVSIPEFDGLTQARRIEDATLMAREHIAVALDVAISEVEVTIGLIDVDGINLSEAIAELEAEKVATEAARDRVAEYTRQLAKTLAGKRSRCAISERCSGCRTSEHTNS